MSRIIEVCCTGNIGRSPLIEVIGNKVVADQGLEAELTFVSSGTRAAKVFEEHWPYGRADLMLSCAKKAGILTDEQAEIDEERYRDTEDPYRAEKIAVIKKVRGALVRIESIARDLALVAEGFPVYENERTPLEPREGIIAVLGAAPKHAVQAKVVYSEFPSEKPTITTVHTYARREGAFEAHLGSVDPAPYRRLITNLREIMPLVVQKARQTHGF